MMNLKVLFVGVGSIAKRHIRNLSKLMQPSGGTLVVDVFRSAAGRALDADVACLVSNVYSDYEAVPNDYDAVFITNPTQLHLETLARFHSKGRHFFIEKPLCTVAQLKNVKHDFFRKDSVYYVACPLRYTGVIQHIKRNIPVESVRSVRSISSSYLPDWRPGTDYRKTYSASRELGGGVSIDLIHEWDYLYYLFGAPSHVCNVIGKVSDLEIDSDDIALYIAKYPHMTVELHLDYFGRVPIRKIELFTDKDTVVCDLINGSVTYEKGRKIIKFPTDRDTWQTAELAYFIELIINKEYGVGNIETAQKVLAIAGGIKL